MKAQVRRLKERVAELKLEADPKADQDAARRLSDRAWIIVHPDVCRAEPELRPHLWPWFQLHEVHSYATDMKPWEKFSTLVRPLADATEEWVECLGDEQGWWPMNPATVHWWKLTGRACGYKSHRGIEPGAFNGTYPNGDPKPVWRPSGADEAEPIDEFFPGSLRPWSREFNPDPASWPEGLRAKVQRSLSLWPEWPDPPGEFNWAAIGRSWNGETEWPYPRGEDGRPVPGGLEGSLCDRR